MGVDFPFNERLVEFRTCLLSQEITYFNSMTPSKGKYFEDDIHIKKVKPSNLNYYLNSNDISFLGINLLDKLSVKNKYSNLNAYNYLFNYKLDLNRDNENYLYNEDIQKNINESILKLCSVKEEKFEEKFLQRKKIRKKKKKTKKKTKGNKLKNSKTLFNSTNDTKSKEDSDSSLYDAEDVFGYYNKYDPDNIRIQFQRELKYRREEYLESSHKLYPSIEKNKIKEERKTISEHIEEEISNEIKSVIEESEYKEESRKTENIFNKTNGEISNEREKEKNEEEYEIDLVNIGNIENMDKTQSKSEEPKIKENKSREKEIEIGENENKGEEDEKEKEEE
ncbi:MAG: hypothetical protein MJ252_25185, partial [archaeon]|nr:hypothetical protein [archaeon]